MMGTPILWGWPVKKSGRNTWVLGWAYLLLCVPVHFPKSLQAPKSKAKKKQEKRNTPPLKKKYISRWEEPLIFGLYKEVWTDGIRGKVFLNFSCMFFGYVHVQVKGQWSLNL